MTEIREFFIIFPRKWSFTYHEEATVPPLNTLCHIPLLSPAALETQQMFVFAHLALGMGISSYNPAMLFAFPPTWTPQQLQTGRPEGYCFPSLCSPSYWAWDSDKEQGRMTSSNALKRLPAPSVSDWTPDTKPYQILGTPLTTKGFGSGLSFWRLLNNIELSQQTPLCSSPL